MSLITLTTDFGTGSPYVAAMKGVILSIDPAATVVDLTHAVRPQAVRHGAIVLDDVTERFPPGTIHLAVVDPGVGTDRAIVYAEIGRQRYVAPDNGLLSRVARRTRPERIVRLTDPEYWLPEVSPTFHGRDIMAPVAARLGLGLDPGRLGPPLEKLVDLDWPQPQLAPGRITGEVLVVDSFGNLVTNIDAGMLRRVPPDRPLRVAVDEREVEGICSTYGEQPSGTLIALVGSTGRLELAVVNDNAAAMFGVQVGAPVSVTWK